VVIGEKSKFWEGKEKESPAGLERRTKRTGPIQRSRNMCVIIRDVRPGGAMNDKGGKTVEHTGQEDNWGKNSAIFGTGVLH